VRARRGEVNGFAGGRGNKTMARTSCKDGVRLDNGFRHHPKILRAISLAGPSAGWLWVCAIDWSNAETTDGRLHRLVVAHVAPGVSARAANDIAERLVEAELWERDGEHYVVHDFHDYQPASGDVLASREDLTAKRAQAGRKGAASRWQTGWQTDGKPDGKAMANAMANGMANGMANAVRADRISSEGSPVPSPPSEDENENESARASRGDGKADGKPNGKPFAIPFAKPDSNHEPPFGVHVRAAPLPNVPEAIADDLEATPETVARCLQAGRPDPATFMEDFRAVARGKGKLSSSWQDEIYLYAGTRQRWDAADRLKAKESAQAARGAAPVTDPAHRHWKAGGGALK